MPVSNAFSLYAIRIERASERFGDRGRLAVGLAEGDDDQRPIRPDFAAGRHGEAQLDRAAADAADADGGLELLVHARRGPQVEMELHPWQPDIQALPQRRVRE